ncbi:hypothetical protein B842_05130 [Corynebacterium humireducens NBRC 106098 = DSM 45392]|uniref:Thioredoxin domain-containing protein n=1 Tax=Corynebacterium humireducens NBRC 106098 = DSM 45392 TaxID=1223515 RepID=A0A0B5D6T3_9CORY|nr:tetratricopeptide repeat protein [Corynebacterium humireducens]AJE32877.1 hypothetical protein B842_05130 [Corynebacterium humireducens NBRC 106098 = DSM 45392]
MVDPAHVHDGCTPDRHRDAVVAGLVALTATTTPTTPAEPQQQGTVRPVVSVTGVNLAAEVIERSQQVPVIVLIGAPLQSGMKELRSRLTSLAEGAGLRWILGILDPDKDPGAAVQFRPRQVPSAFAVAGGTTVAVFEPGLPGRDIADWVEEVVRSTGGRLRGLDEAGEAGEEDTHSVPAAFGREAQLRRAAEAVDSGDFAGAVAVYGEMLASAPGDPVLLRARAAVSVLVRVQRMDRTRDPVQAAVEDPGDVDKVLDAADALVMLDQPGEAVELLAARVGEPRVRERALELLALLDPADPVVAATRQRVASALYA